MNTNREQPIRRRIIEEFYPPPDACDVPSVLEGDGEECDDEGKQETPAIDTE